MNLRPLLPFAIAVSVASGAFAAQPAAAADTKATPAGRDISYNAVTAGPRTPEEERRAFQLPPGFEIELVAAESPGIGKFVGLAWDARMQLWTMTALEYPVDGNEQKAASDALFARGGRDRVVVFDNVFGADVGVAAKPRVFADGLVMPLGVLPYRDGAFVQYGADIRFYRDTDGDGRADRHEVLLTGFGTQDSHLFPHQFYRQPGGTFFVAQGLFNYSTVSRPGGAPFANSATTIPFNQCKLALVSLDGARFESVTAGPNNIWGLIASRDGETFMQEANDLGYPVIPYAPGIWVTTGSRDRLRPYQPLMPPPLAPAQMGGTGLSGLVLAEDRDGLFRRFGTAADDATKVFFLANPITNTVNTVRATPDGPRYRYEKLPDFLTTDDKWFRPVAISFGPDGALYLVDWYNQIISHNEVPRDHPDRDKTRGRIWRIRHRDQPRVTPPDLTRLDDRALLPRLGDPNAVIARLAWLEIGDRRTASLAPALAEMAKDKSASVDRRLGALWALEMVQPVETTLLHALVDDTNVAIRREAVRIACAQPRPEGELASLLAASPRDAHPSVRVALADGLRHVANAGPNLIALAGQLARSGSNADSAWESYEREHERYLARWAMEVHADATRALLARSEVDPEAQALAAVALGDRAAAVRLAALRPALARAFDGEEIRLLAANFAEPTVRVALGSALGQPATRTAVLRALLAVRAGFDAAPLREDLVAAARALLAGSGDDAVVAAQVAGAFHLDALESTLVALLEKDTGGKASTSTLAALRALREMGAGPAELFERLVRRTTDAALRDEALNALASSPTSEAATRLVGLLPRVTAVQRARALDRLSGTAAGASAVMAGVASGTVAKTDLVLGVVEKLRTQLPADAALVARWQELGGDARRALRLPGGAGDFMDTQISLDGAFTIEAWLKLDPEINARDGLLGAGGQFDLNFHEGRFRAWLPDANDVVVARKRAVPGVWTHYAVTRDREGVFRLYLDGELDGTGAAKSQAAFTALNVGRSRVNPSVGTTGGWLAEYRVWTVARTPEEIRENFDRSFAGVASAPRPAGLAHVFAGASWGPLRGDARAEIVDDAPVLLTEAEAAAQTAKFARFRALAHAPGDAERGRELFTTICLACHQQGGKGGQIAPPLDGVGNTGVEALLRNILTPSAAMESAYQTFRVTLKDGSVIDAFLVEQNADAIVVRLPGTSDRTIARSDVRSAGYLRRSLMPEGLLESLAPGQVSDLFAHLRSLR